MKYFSKILFLYSFIIALTLSTALKVGQLKEILNPCGQPNKAAPGENINCESAFPFITKALKKYELNTPQLTAFYISYIGFESGNLTFVRNKFPGNPGHGTRSMMMPANLIRFIHDTFQYTFSFGRCFNCFRPKVIQTYISQRKPGDESTIDKETDDQLNFMLNRLVINEVSFLPGAWWITSGASSVYGNQYPVCKDTVGLINKGTDDAIQLMLQNCTGTGSDNQARILFYKYAFDILTKK